MIFGLGRTTKQFIKMNFFSHP